MDHVIFSFSEFEWFLEMNQAAEEKLMLLKVLKDPARQNRGTHGMENSAGLVIAPFAF